MEGRFNLSSYELSNFIRKTSQKYFFLRPLGCIFSWEDPNMASEGTAGDRDPGGEGSLGLPAAGPERSLKQDQISRRNLIRMTM